METLFITTETRKNLKWLDQFVDKEEIDSYLNAVFVYNDSLIAMNYHSAAQIKIPRDLKDFCQELVAFEIVAITTKPPLLITKPIPFELDDKFDGYRVKRDKVIESMQSNEENLIKSNFKTVLNPEYLAQVKGIPGDSPLKIYISHREQPVILDNSESRVIISPIHID